MNLEDKKKAIDGIMSTSSRGTAHLCANRCGWFIYENVMYAEERAQILQWIYDKHPTCPFTWLIDTSTGLLGPTDVTLKSCEYSTLCVAMDVAAATWPNNHTDDVMSWFDACRPEEAVRFALWTLYGGVPLLLGDTAVGALSNWDLRAALRPCGWGSFRVDQNMADVAMQCAVGRSSRREEHAWMPEVFALLPEPDRTYMFSARFVRIMSGEWPLASLFPSASGRYAGTCNYWALVWPIISAARKAGVSPEELVLSDLPIDGSNQVWARDDDDVFTAPDIITDAEYWAFHPRAIQSLFGIDREILYGEPPERYQRYYSTTPGATFNKWLDEVALVTALFGT